MREPTVHLFSVRVAPAVRCCAGLAALLAGAAACSEPPVAERVSLAARAARPWQPAPVSLLDTAFLSATDHWRDGVLDVLASDHPSDFLWAGWSGVEELAPGGSVGTRGYASTIRFLLYPVQELTRCVDGRLVGGDVGETEIAAGINGSSLDPLRLGAQRRRICVPIEEDALRWGFNWLEFHFRGPPPDPLIRGAPRAPHPRGARIHRITLEASEPITGPEIAGVRFGEDAEVRPSLVQNGSGRQHVLVSLPESSELRLEIARPADPSPDAGPVDGSVYVATDDGQRQLWFGTLAPGERTGPIRLDLGAFRQRAVQLQFSVGEGAAERDWFWIDPRIVRRPLSPPGRIEERLAALEGAGGASVPPRTPLRAPNAHLVLVTVDELPPANRADDSEDDRAGASSAHASSIERFLSESVVFAGTPTTSLDPSRSLADLAGRGPTVDVLEDTLAGAGWSLAEVARGAEALDPLVAALASASKPVFAALRLETVENGEITRLTDALRAAEVLDECVVAVVGLRGEASATVAPDPESLAEASLAVGWWVRMPRGEGAARVDLSASIGDGAPTLLGFLGVEARESAAGTDLQQRLADPGAAPRFTAASDEETGAQVLWFRSFRYAVDPAAEVGHRLSAGFTSRASAAPAHPVTAAFLEQSQLALRREREQSVR